MNCKPGDLAVIVGCQVPENNGHIVEVVERDYDVYDTPEPRWLVRCPTPLHGHDVDTGESQWGNEGSLPDSCLRPISGVPVGEETEIEAPA